MEYLYCKYCGQYKSSLVYSKPKKRCDACERHAKDRFDAELEIELSHKADYYKNPVRPLPKRAAPASQDLLNKRRKRQEVLDLQAIEEEYML
jgi:hypothetical protein